MTTTMDKELTLPPEQIFLAYAEKNAEHFFKSPNLPGFLAAGRDLNKLYNDLDVLVSAFVRIKFQRDMPYRVETSYDDFSKKINSHRLFNTMITARAEAA